MSQPKAEDLLLALDVVREVQAAPDLDAYRHAVLRVAELVPCQEIGYNEVDAETNEIFMILDPPEAVLPGLDEAFARTAHQHPVITHHRESGDGSARAISDFLSEEEFHATDLYREVYGPMGAEDQLAFILPSPPDMAGQIAKELVISVHTARNHIANVYEKLGVRNRAGAVAAVLRSKPPQDL